MRRISLVTPAVVIALTLVACGGGATPLVVTAPAGVGAAADYGIVTVSWSYDGKTPDSFEVWRGESGGAEPALLATVPAASRSYEDKTVVIGDPYVYRVVAVGDGASHESPLTSAVTAEPGIALVMGTYRWAANERPFTAFGIYMFTGEGIPSGTYFVEMLGPAGWNAGAILLGGYDSDYIRQRAYANIASGAYAELGEYTLTLRHEGTGEVLHSATATLDDLTMLPKLNLAVTLTSSSISAS